VLVYFDAYSMGAVLTAMGVGIALAVGVHILTRDEEELPTLDLGTRCVFDVCMSFALTGSSYSLKRLFRQGRGAHGHLVMQRCK